MGGLGFILAASCVALIACGISDRPFCVCKRSSRDAGSIAVILQWFIFPRTLLSGIIFLSGCLSAYSV